MKKVILIEEIRNEDNELEGYLVEHEDGSLDIIDGE